MVASRAEFESRSLVWAAVAGYAVTLVAGTVGAMLGQDSYPQLLLFQVGDAAGVSASVVAGRYVGLRGQQVAASAFILMGITHGISLAGAGVESLSTEKSITLIMPMIPAMAMMAWCTLFPRWLRVVGLLPAVLFTIVYVRVLSGADYFDWPTATAYSLWNMTEVLWAAFILRDVRREERVGGP